MYDNRRYVFIFPLTPSPFTFSNPPPPFRFSFLASIMHPSSMQYNVPPYHSLEWSAKHRQHPPAISHPSSATYLQLYDIWWGGQGKSEEAGGEEGKGGAGVGRGEKDVKILEGGEKEFILRAPLREVYPLSTPTYLKTGDDSYSFKHIPKHTHFLVWGRL